MSRIKLTTLKPSLATLPSRLRTTAQASASYGQGRGGRPWRRLVEQVKLRDQYTCRCCGLVTEQGECDHIVPVSQGGTDALSNLQWLCKEPCHADKTAREAAEAQGGAGKVRIGADGWPVR